jgi:hypothetical protein
MLAVNFSKMVSEEDAEKLLNILNKLEEVNNIEKIVKLTCS